MDWPTIIVAAVVVLLFALVIFFHFRNKKRGKHSCSCGSCSGCAMSGSCHGGTQQNK